MGDDMGNAKQPYRFLNCHVGESDAEVTARFMARLSPEAKSDLNQAARHRFIKSLWPNIKRRKIYFARSVFNVPVINRC